MLKLENIEKTYETGTVALKGVSLEFGDKGLVSIVGQSGSGKSTLLNLITRIDDVTSGSMYLDGVDYTKANKATINDDFAYIYQDYKLIENITVMDNVRLASELCHNAFDGDMIDILNDVGIGDYANEKVSNLSGGQKQRVAIARALVRCPKVLIADEPTGNLDKENSENVFELLKKVSNSRLVIVVTHDSVLANRYSDRIVSLDYGVVDSDIDNTSSAVAVETTASSKNIEKKKRIGKKSVLALAKSLNRGKIVHRIINVALSALLTAAFVLMISLSLINYEQLIEKNISINEIKPLGIELSKDGKEGSGNVNLSALEKYLTEQKISFAKVYDMPTPKDEVQYVEEGDDTPPPPNLEKYSKVGDDDQLGDKTPMTIAYSMLLQARENRKIIVSNNVESIGMKIVAGRNVQAEKEVMIPRSEADYAIRAQYFGRFNLDAGKVVTEYTFNSYDDLLKASFNGIKIVGIYEDNFAKKNKYIDTPAQVKEYYEVSEKEFDLSKSKFLSLEDQIGVEFKMYKFIKERVLCNTYVTSVAPDTANTSLMVDGSKMTAGKLRALEKFLLKEYNAKLDNFEGVRYSFYHDNGQDLGAIVAMIKMGNKHLYIPGIFIVLGIIILLIYNQYVISIKYSSRDILTMRALGATKGDIIKVLSISAIVILIIDLIIGMTLGIVYTIFTNNGLVKIIGEMGTVSAILPVNALAIIISIATIIGVNAIALVLNVIALRDKNLRKAFQKAR